MRISRGILRGRHIPNKYPSTTRPIEGKIKDAIFDIIGDVYDAKCLDLYSGTGALGLESLSRGAKEVYFNDINKRKLDYIKRLLSIWNYNKTNYRFIKGDAIKIIEVLWRNKERFDVVFSDPPFSKEVNGKNIAQATLDAFSKMPLIDDSGIYITRVYKKVKLDIPENMELLLERRYGINRVYFLTMKKST